MDLENLPKGATDLLMPAIASAVPKSYSRDTMEARQSNLGSSKMI